MSIRLVDESLFAATDPVALRGSACGDCGAHIFPAMGTCPVCTGVDVTDVALPTEGTVWSWTTQHFEPKAPYRTDSFAPFSIGYVDLGTVIVEGWLVGKNEWSIGERVRLVLATAWSEDGETVHTYGFETASEGSA